MPDDVPFVEATLLDERRRRGARCASTTSSGVIHLAGFKYAGVSVAAAAAHLRAERHRHDHAARGDGRGRRRPIVFSSSAATYGTPDVDLVTEETPTTPGVAVRREQADRRVAAARRRPGARPPAHVAALLQRRRLGLARPLRHQPAQPVPAGLRRPGRGPHAAHQRRPTTRPRTAPACATTCTSPTSPTPTSSPRAALLAGDDARAGLQPRQRRRRLGAADHGHGPRGDRHRVRAGGRASAVPATRPGSSPAASWPPATSGWEMRHDLQRHGALGLGGPASGAAPPDAGRGPTAATRVAPDEGDQPGLRVGVLGHRDPRRRTARSRGASRPSAPCRRASPRTSRGRASRPDRWRERGPRCA